MATTTTSKQTSGQAASKAKQVDPAPSNGGAQVADRVRSQSNAAVAAKPAAPVAAAPHQAAAPHAAAPQAAAPAAAAPKFTPGPSAAAPTTLSKGALARKNLEDTEVVGKNASGVDRSSPRGDALATAILKGAFQATADVLAGPSFDADPHFQASFIAGWKKLNPTFDDQTALKGPDLLRPMLTAKFKGNKLGYLEDLRHFGSSSAKWEVLMCLGEVEGGMASDDAVVRAVERAAEKLDDAQFQLFWKDIEAPLKKNMHHILTSDRRLTRVLAAKKLKDSEAPVAKAEGELQVAEGAEKAADKKKETTEATLKVSEQGKDAADIAEKQAKKDLKTAKTGRDGARTARDDGRHAVEKDKTDATKAGKDLAAAKIKIDADKQALAEANQANEDAMHAYDEAMAFLKEHQARETAARQRAAMPAAEVAPAPAPAAHADGAPKDEAAELHILAAKSEEAWQLAMAAAMRTAEARAQIEQAEADLAKSNNSVTKATEAQQKAQDSLAVHEEELTKRKAELVKAKANVDAAQKKATEAKAKAEEAEKAVKALEAKLAVDDTALTAAKTDVKGKQDVLAQKKKDQVATGAEVEYLAALIESLGGKLNDFDREALDQVSEWAAKHQQAVPDAMKADSKFMVALNKFIKKDRNKEVIKAIIKGEQATTIKEKLAGTDPAHKGAGFDAKETDAALQQVTMAALVVDREAQKHKEKKVQIRVGPAKIEHVVLKQQLLSMTPDAREQYLAFATDKSKAELANPVERAKALKALDDKLRDKCGVVDDKERERMLALFKVAGAGVNYSKLYGLVHTTSPDDKYKTDDDFAKKALVYISAFDDGEFHQLRQDSEVLAAINVCKKREEINKIVGGLVQVPVAGGKKPDEKIAPLGAAAADKKTAETDALHRPEHWSTLINVEMDKWRVSPRDERNRNDVYRFAYRAQQTGLEVARAKDPAATTAHVDSKKFVADVWTGISSTAQDNMKSQYPELATALAAGDGVTVDMVLASIAKFHVGSWKFHVDKKDLEKTIEAAKGRELLDQWSNIGTFKTEAAKLADADQKREYTRGFVLDINTEKREFLDSAVGSGSVELANKLRGRFKQAAESDGEFQAGLHDAGYDNSKFNREKIEFKGLLEKAGKARRGWDVDGFSSKGHVQHQAQREFVGGLRKANKDDQAINDKKAQAGADAHKLDEERDEHFEKDHAKNLDEKKEELELSGEEFEKLRENIKKFTEIAISVIIAIAISAATMGAVPAWAVVLAKVGAAILTEIVKEVVANAITGDQYNAQRLVTGIAVGAVGAAAGGFAGMGVEAGADGMNTFLKEFIKGGVMSVASNLGKDGVKAAAERNAGEVSITGAVKNQVLGFVIATASSQITAAVMEAKGISGYESDKDAQSDAASKLGDHATGAQLHIDHAQASVTGAQGAVAADHARMAADHADITKATGNLTTAHDQVAQAQHHLALAQQKYDAAVKGHASASTVGADKHQLAEARGQVTTAHAHVVSAQQSVHADQARLAGDRTALESDHAKLETANAKLEAAQTHLEHINEKIEAHEAAGEADEASIKAIEGVGRVVDTSGDSILDQAADVIQEAIGERAKSKLEATTPKTKAAEEPAAHHGKP